MPAARAGGRLLQGHREDRGLPGLDHRHRGERQPDGAHHRQAAADRGASQGEGRRTVVIPGGAADGARSGFHAAEVSDAAGQPAARGSAAHYHDAARTNGDRRTARPRRGGGGAAEGGLAGGAGGWACTRDSRGRAPARGRPRPGSGALGSSVGTLHG